MAGSTRDPVGAEIKGAGGKTERAKSNKDKQEIGVRKIDGGNEIPLLFTRPRGSKQIEVRVKRKTRRKKGDSTALVLWHQPEKPIANMTTVAPAGSDSSVLNSNVRPAIARLQSYTPNGIPAPPISGPQILANETKNAPGAVLELIDGTAFSGISFGAQGKSVAGECVFQTGARMAPAHICFCYPQG